MQPHSPITSVTFVTFIYIAFILNLSKTLFVTRLDICYDRHDQRLYKNCSSFVIFSESNAFPYENCVEIRNLLIYLVNLLTFPPNLLKFYIFFSISKKGPKPIFLKFTPYIVLAKRVTIYVFLLCKLFGQKIRFCKIFDKFQVCL